MIDAANAPNVTPSENCTSPTSTGAGITIAQENGSTLEEAQRLANHTDIRTTMLYDRRDKTVKRSVIERIVI